MTWEWEQDTPQFSIPETEKELSGVPTGAPDPIWFGDGVVDYICRYDCETFNRLNGCVELGAMLMYPDTWFDVWWDFLRPVEYPYEMPQGGDVEIFSAKHYVDDGSHGGGVDVGLNDVPMFSVVEREDFSPSIDGNGVVATLPSGLYLVEAWHIAKTATAVRDMQLVIEAHLDPEPPYYFYGELARVPSNAASITLHASCNLLASQDTELRVYMWSSGATGTYALGYGVSGREITYGRIKLTKVS